MKFTKICLCALAYSAYCGAMSTSLLFSEQAAAVDACSKEALMAYFPESFVKSSLKKFNIPEDKWAAIAKALHEKEKDVIKTVESKASKMNPNPLKDPSQRQVATKLFKETLIEVAKGPFKDNGVPEDKIQGILDDIQQQKARQFAQCIESHKLPAPGSKLNNVRNSDNDDDDSDDD